MNSLGIFQLALKALEGVACALNPRLRKQEKKRAVGFGLLYVGFLIGGAVIVVMVLRSLYFQK